MQWLDPFHYFYYVRTYIHTQSNTHTARRRGPWRQCKMLSSFGVGEGFPLLLSEWMRGRSRYSSKECNKRKTRRDKQRRFNLLMEFDVDQINREFFVRYLSLGSCKRNYTHSSFQYDRRPINGAPFQTCNEITVKRQTILYIVFLSQSVKNLSSERRTLHFSRHENVSFSGLNQGTHSHTSYKRIW